MRYLKASCGKYKFSVGLDTEQCENVSGWKVERHCHIQYELHIVLEGFSTVDIEAETQILSKSDALIIAPGQYHCPKQTSDDYRHFSFSFTVSDDSFFKNVFPSQKFKLSDFDLSVCEQIIFETQNCKTFWNEAINALYSYLICSVFRTITHSALSEEKKSLSLSDNRYNVIDDFFERHLNTDASEGLLCENLGLSKRQLSRVLKNQYGMTFRNKLCYARMDRAAWLLRTTDKSIAQICELVGYSSSPSFFKAFKKHYKMTPFAYRKQLNEIKK